MVSPPERGNIIGLTYNLEPDGVVFSPPATITMTYLEVLIPVGVSENDLVIGSWDVAQNQWTALEGCIVDPVNNQITAPLSHLSTHAILHIPPKVSPASFSLGSLVISPAAVNPGQPISISVPVTNNGGSADKYVLTFKINNIEVETREIIVGPGLTQNVQFSSSVGVSGEYIADINGNVGKFQVIEPVQTTQAPSLTPTVETPPVTNNLTSTNPTQISPQKGKSTPLGQWTILFIVIFTGVLIGSIILLLRRKTD
jgi:hypothetical protein